MEPVSREALKMQIELRISKLSPSRVDLGGFHTGQKSAYLNVLDDLAALPTIEPELERALNEIKYQVARNDKCREANQRLLDQLQSIQQERDKLEQQVNTLQEELNIAHYANETLSNQYHKIREHNHMQGQKIQTLQGQVNTLTKFLVDFRERTPYGLYQEQIDTVLLSLESPREEQTK